MRRLPLVLCLVAWAASATMPYDPRQGYHRAVLNGDAARTRAALENGVGTADSFGDIFQGPTPLAVAVLNGHLEVVKVLLEARAKVENPHHALGLPPGWNLRCAARLHKPALDALLVKAKASPPLAGCMNDVQFILAAQRGSVKDVRAASFPLGLSLETAELALSAAVRSKKPDVARAVIEVSGNPRLAAHTHVDAPDDPLMKEALEGKPQ